MRYAGSRRFHRPVLLLAGVLGVALVAAACSGPPNPGEAAAAETGQPGSRPSDDVVTAWVREALQDDPRIVSRDVRVRAADGIVTLEGTVASLAEKRFATLEAMKIDGVRGVIDEIVVAPASRPDEEIRADVLRRLTRNRAPRVREVGVRVVDGDVIVTGQVDSWSEREDVETLLSEIRGVRAVEDRLEVVYRSPRSDREIRDDVVDALDRDVYLSDLPIVATVRDAVVTLRGEVGSPYEKQRAESDVYLAAPVRAVTNELSVDWLRHQGVRDQSPAPSDARLRDAVLAELTHDPRLRAPSNITVGVDDGEVTLRGAVSDARERRLAGRDARDVVGVQGVVNLLAPTVASRDDAAIAHDVEVELRGDYALASLGIRATVEEGVVTLSGQVNSYFEKDHAARLASDVPGVRDVVDDLVVGTAAGYTDAALQERIENRLASNWKTRRLADRIHVAVEDGWVVLTGNVDDASQRLEAASVARLTAGVAGVTDRLSVRGAAHPPVAPQHP